MDNNILNLLNVLIKFAYKMSPHKQNQWKTFSPQTIWRIWLENWIHGQQLDEHDLKIESAANNWTIMSWKLNPQPTIRQLWVETCIHDLQFDEHELKTKSTAYNLTNMSWKLNPQPRIWQSWVET